jgi:predicted GNAT superfamily acetyltransferase
MTEATTSPALQHIRVQALHTAEEMQVCVQLQQSVWGYSPLDTVPDQIFIVAAKTGGHVLVAYDRETAVGFALAFAAVRNNQAYLHSHMVAVLEDYQNRGVGRLLKLSQREDALRRGFDLIEWTFDPLQLKNARFNIDRLGAIARQYVPNLYGRTSSRLHAGLPTDRLVAQWWVRSPRVANILSEGSEVVVRRAHPSSNGNRVAVSIPANIRELCGENPHQAQELQSAIREQFSSYFGRGLAVVGFELNQQHGAYLLEPYEN